MGDISVFVEAHANTLQKIVKVLSEQLEAIWRAASFYDDDSVRVAVMESVALVEQAQLQARRVTGSYNRALFRELDFIFPDVAANMGTYPRRSVFPEDVWGRPAEMFRFLRSTNVAGHEALNQTITRIRSMVEDEIQFAVREESARIYGGSDDVIGYRRVFHPELSITGVCGLCMVASDNVYASERLLPIHSHCKCTTVPVGSYADPGAQINDADLKRLYEAGGSAKASDLKAIRVQDFTSSEMGPVLTSAGVEVEPGGTRVRITSSRDKEFQVKGEVAESYSSAPTIEFQRDYTKRRIENLELWLRANSSSPAYDKTLRVLREQEALFERLAS